MVYYFFPVSLFLSAWLLFAIQPMVAKLLLPYYGGTPAVWTVCLLFFQLLMLVGYAYAWCLSRFNSMKTWRFTHVGVCLLSFLFFPISFNPNAQVSIPELAILFSLVSIFLPLLVVSASAPLIQLAYSLWSHQKQYRDPYFLYAASNAGSLMALLSYPFLVERFTALHTQLYSWRIIYLTYILLCLGLLLGLPYRDRSSNQARAEQPISLTTKFYWCFFSFIPCSLMLGVTFFISTDVAPTPLFWVLPLSLYLISFIATFAKKPWVNAGWFKRIALLSLIFPASTFICGAYPPSAWFLMLAHLGNFFIWALFLNSELIKTRPPAGQLTTFYLCMALGGALAGLFNGLIAPHLFNQAIEYPLVMILGLLAVPMRKKDRPWFIPVITFLLLCLKELLYPLLPAHSQIAPWIDMGILGMILLCPRGKVSFFISLGLLLGSLLYSGAKYSDNVAVLDRQRNFYGIKQVTVSGAAHRLMSQSTLHGFQFLIPEQALNGGATYYGAIVPVTRDMEALYSSLRVGVVGLGIGTIACQFRKEDHLQFIEIDKQVIDIAKNPRVFTYLSQCPPAISIIEGDGRLALSKLADASYQLLVMDAFNSDAVPVHLLTLEAFKLYKTKLTPDGVILVHISNRYLDLLPVLVAEARQLGMIILYKDDLSNLQLGQLPSQWALLTTNESLANTFIGRSGWHFVTKSDEILWTDDYSNVIPLLKWVF